jgi:O-6-methylguanine DNA methyltransferase
MSNKEPVLQKKEFIKGPGFNVHVFYENGAVQRSTIEEGPIDSLQWQLWSSKNDLILQTLLSDWFEAYSQGKKYAGKIPFNFFGLPCFMQEVLEVVNGISFGATFSYQEVAQMANRPFAAKAVGSSCRRNPFHFLIPCHRVLGSKKNLKKYDACMDLRQKLLAFEWDFN